MIFVDIEPPRLEPVKDHLHLPLAIAMAVNVRDQTVGVPQRWHIHLRDQIDRVCQFQQEIPGPRLARAGIHHDIGKVIAKYVHQFPEAAIFQR